MLLEANLLLEEKLEPLTTSTLEKVKNFVDAYIRLFEEVPLLNEYVEHTNSATSEPVKLAGPVPLSLIRILALNEATYDFPLLSGSPEEEPPIFWDHFNRDISQKFGIGTIRFFTNWINSDGDQAVEESESNVALTEELWSEIGVDRRVGDSVKYNGKDYQVLTIWSDPDDGSLVLVEAGSVDFDAWIQTKPVSLRAGGFS